jgi:hypothetical protein
VSVLARARANAAGDSHHPDQGDLDCK